MDSRSCTDICCLIVFLVLVVLILALGIYAWFAGNFAHLTTAYDPDGKGCGVAFKNYPYIYFASPHANVPLTPCSHSGSPSAYPSAPCRETMCSSASPTVW